MKPLPNDSEEEDDYGYTMSKLFKGFVFLTPSTFTRASFLKEAKGGLRRTEVETKSKVVLTKPHNFGDINHWLGMAAEAEDLPFS